MIINVKAMKSNISIAIIIVCVILNSGYLTQVTSLQDYSYIMNFSLFVFLFIIVYFRRIKIVVDNRIVLFMFIMLSILLAIVLKDEQIKSSITPPIYILNAYFITLIFSKIDILKCFCNSVFYISVISLFFYFLITVINIAPTGRILDVGLTENNQYVNLFVYFYRYSQWNPFQIRNQGIFWEPGLFSSFIILAIVFNLFFDLNLKKYKIYILFITLLTTKSTAAYILMILVFLLWLSKNTVYKRRNIRDVSIYALLFLSVIAFAFQDSIFDLMLKINPILFSKLVIENENSSLITRLSSPIVLYKIWFLNPIIGLGASNTTSLYIEMLSNNLNSLTSTSLYMLASYGLSGILYSFYWMLGCFKQKRIFIQNLLLFILLFLILNKEPHYNILIMWIILFALISGGYHENTCKQNTIE